MIHDSDAPSQVFTEISTGKKASKNKVKQRGDLEEEFGFSSKDLRANEGEAAEHGVFYDDTSYDYMQHMRDLGTGGGEATWIEAKGQKQDKGKAKQSLEDALRESSLDDRSDMQSEGGVSYAGRSAYRSSAYNPSVYSSAPHRSTYEQQVDVPDALAGFQPDMDPRLREVLEALEDEAYVEDDDEIFEALAGQGAEEIDEYEFEESGYLDEDEQGWESDDTTKPVKEYQAADLPATGAHSTTTSSASQNEMPGFQLRSSLETSDTATTDPTTLPPSDAPAPDLPSDASWAFLKDAPPTALSSNTTTTPLPPPSSFPIRPAARSKAAPSDLGSTTSSALGRRKKRKGALTSDTGFSMTSSSLARTEELSTLDARFDKIAAHYMDEIDEEGDGADFDPDDPRFDTMSRMTGMTGMSKMSGLTGMTSRTRKSAWATPSVAGSEAPSLVSVSANGGGEAGFHSVMDEFLGSAAGQKGRRMKKGGKAGVVMHQGGMEQLDEIRSGLGAARFSSLGRTNGRANASKT